MEAIQSRKLAIDQNPELSRMYHVVRTEILHQSNKGQFYLKKPFDKSLFGFAEIVSETLKKEGYEVRILKESAILEIKW